MARSSYDVREEYTGTGLLDTYSFDFKIEALTQLLIIELNASGVETQRVRGDDVTYLSTVTFDAISGGGEITLAAVLTNQYKLIILLANDEPTQPNEFREKSEFTLKRLEMALDWVLGPVQRLAYLAKRSVKLSDHDDITDFDPSLPPGLGSDSVDASDLIPATNATGTGWADLDDWIPVVDLTNAVTAADEAADSAAAAAVSETAAAASAAASAASAAASAASAALAAAAANIAPDIQGTRIAPVAITATGLSAFSSDRYKNYWFVEGSGGAVDITTNPQIAAGTVLGQELEIIGCSNTNTLFFEDGTGLVLQGDWLAQADRVLRLGWNGANWYEKYRS